MEKNVNLNILYLIVEDNLENIVSFEKLKEKVLNFGIIKIDIKDKNIHGQNSKVLKMIESIFDIIVIKD